MDALSYSLCFDTTSLAHRDAVGGERPLVLSPRPNNVRTLIDDLARQHGVAVEPAVELSLIGIKREFLIHFNYCAVLPSGLFLGDWDGGQISCRRIVNPSVSRTMSLLFSRGMHAGVAACLVDMAKPYIAEHIAKSGFQWRLPEKEISRPETFDADDPPVPMYSGPGVG